jgi:hypothetical protein
VALVSFLLLATSLTYLYTYYSPPLPLPLWPPTKGVDILSISEIIVNRTIVVTIDKTQEETHVRFSPSHVMAVGDHVTLKIINEDDVPRAFAVDEWNITSGHIDPKTSITIEFIPQQEGSPLA